MRGLVAEGTDPHMHIQPDSVIRARGFPLQATHQWVVERPNAWHNHGSKMLLACKERRTRVIDP